MIKKLLLAAIIALIVAASAVHADEDCVATDKCMLFTDIKDLYNMAVLFQNHSDDDMQFGVNELAVSGKLFKLNRGTRLKVVAKKKAIYQVYYNGRLFYTTEGAVKCQ